MLVWSKILREFGGLIAGNLPFWSSTRIEREFLRRNFSERNSPFCEGLRKSEAGPKAGRNRPTAVAVGSGVIHAANEKLLPSVLKVKRSAQKCDTFDEHAFEDCICFLERKENPAMGLRCFVLGVICLAYALGQGNLGGLTGRVTD